MSPQVHPNGFRISDRPVAASFAHPYSFQPVTDFISRDEACLSSSMSLGGVEGTWVRYWDESATVAVLEFQVDEAVQSASAGSKEKEKEKEKKKKLKSTYSLSSSYAYIVLLIAMVKVRLRKAPPLLLPFPFWTSPLH